MDFLLGVFWFVIVTGILVAWHEWGHYWVGKKLGVKAIRFAVGFGKTIYARNNAAGTEFAIKAIPLGGYVKFVDTREGEVAAADLPYAFDQQANWKRSLIILAGPVANLLLTIVALMLMFMVGVSDERAVIGKASGLAETAGLQRFDEIVRIDDHAIGNWTEALIELQQAAYDQRVVKMVVRPAQSSSGERELTLDLTQIPKGFDDQATVLRAAGIRVYTDDAPTIIETIPAADSPAALAGLKAGDQIVMVGDQEIRAAGDFQDALQTIAKANQGAISLAVMRQGQRININAVAKYSELDGFSAWRIGVMLKQVSLDSKFDTLRQLSPIAALPAAGKETWFFMTRSLQMIKSLVTGRASAKNVSGPITIAQAAKASAELGLSRFLKLLALISLSLFIVNLLPIPVLDGGHLLFNAIEAVTGKPPGEKMMLAGQAIGLMFILSLMSLAMFNDLSRVFGG
jgi:regulator of sigma E protease